MIDVPSRIYVFVRARQLEGTYPGDAETGNWPISAWRIARGWGMAPESAWPYPKPGDAWPPIEPIGIDALAKQNQIWAYWRLRSLDECRKALAKNTPIVFSCDITDEWFTATNGQIMLPVAYAKPVGSHCVLLMGYDDKEKVLKFRNSWGGGWGDAGHGTLGYDYFEKFGWEAWVQISSPMRQWQTQAFGGTQIIHWGESVMGTEVHGIDIVRDDDRLAWAIAIRRDGHLEVEDLFVRPENRRKGLGGELAKCLVDVSKTLCLPLRLWVSWADDFADKAGVEKIAGKLGLTLSSSSQRCASRIGMEGTERKLASAQVAPPAKPKLFRFTPK